MGKTTLLKSMLLLCALIVGSGSVWATDVTFDFADYKGKGTSGSGSEFTMVKDAVSIKDSKFYCSESGTYAQLYASGTTTITPSAGVKITRIVLTATSTSYNGYQGSGVITSSMGSVSGSTESTTVIWEGSAMSPFTISHDKQIRWTSIVVTWEIVSKGIDELIYSILPLEGDNGAYRDFSGARYNSSAVYAGNANKTSSLTYIQLRNSSNSGIVSTTSGGKVRKVVVDWNTSTASGRSIQIYGKNTAYTASSDLFSDVNKGTLIGSIIYGTSTELTINDDYEYIGIKAVGGALYMNSVTITWEGDAVSLSDASNYSPVAKDYAKVTLDRSFVAGWNGIVLPFDLTADVQTALGATEVKTLDSAIDTGSGITIGFADAVLPVAAGTPVLVKLSAAKASGDVTINGVELKTTTPTTIGKSAGGSTFTLTGTYSTTDLESSEVYLVSNMKFYHKAASVALTAKPFRAYIVQTGAVPARVGFDLEDGGTTGIIEVNAMRSAGNEAIYNVAGQRVEKAQRGLYIVNGKKVIK